MDDVIKQKLADLVLKMQSEFPESIYVSVLWPGGFMFEAYDSEHRDEIAVELVVAADRITAN
jgi:hypothetical protein